MSAQVMSALSNRTAAAGVVVDDAGDLGCGVAGDVSPATESCPAVIPLAAVPVDP